MKRRTKRKIASGIKVMAMLGVPALLLGAIGTKLIGGDEFSIQNEENACVEDFEIPQAVAFIDFSLTGETSNAQRRDYRSGLLQLYEQVETGTRINFVTTGRGEDSYLGVPRASFCKAPQNAMEREALNLEPKPLPFIKRQVDENRQGYESIVDSILEDASSEEKIARHSPILEILQGISGRDYGGPLRTLHVYTDGYQNSEFRRFGQVQGDLPRHATMSMQSDYGRITPEPWRGTNVIFFMADFAYQMPYATTSEVTAFWRDYFAYHEAQSYKVRILRYGEGS